MQRQRLTLLFVLVTSFTFIALRSVAQTVVATVNVASHPNSLAINPATNKIFVTSGDTGTVTVIDGRTDTTSSPISVGVNPLAIAVNPATNQIYVANASSNTVTVIDGKTLNTTTVGAGSDPLFVAVNVLTNKIYVANQSSNDVTVIDGATNNTTTVPVGSGPTAIAVDSVTNKIYVANAGKNCDSNTVSVIDGATNQAVSVPVGTCPSQVAVNPVTNKIYVTNNQTHSVTVIDGGTLSTTLVQVGNFPTPIAVNSVTNKIYVGNDDISPTVTVIDGASLNTTTLGLVAQPSAIAVNPVTNSIYISVTDNINKNYVSVIDGATNSLFNLPVGNSPGALAVSAVTDRSYVANFASNTVSVIQGVSPAALQFIAVTPCRLIDTRPPSGSGPIQGGTSQNFVIPQLGGCGIPSTAAAYSLNVTAVPSGRLGFLTIWPAGEDQPIVSTMNSLDGRIKADAAIVPAGYQGAVSVYVNNTTNLLLDINGYFAPPNGSTLQYYPMAPCRVVDTRGNPGPLGGPFLNGNQERDFPVLDSSCIPPGPSIKAYSFNVTAVPHPAGQRLGFLAVWPKGEAQPGVSTLNNPTGTTVANAAIVPAGSGGGVAVFPNDSTDLVIDISGYFAAAGSGGLSLYPAAPCRALDTRQVGNGAPFTGELTVDVAGSPCAPPTTAQAYVFNATVVPPGHLGFLTLWPDGEAQPTASTLNATDGAITSNMAIVQTNNGKVDAFANDLTQLLLDISSYFAP